jgi:predicted ribosome quality control (RQC) complex YloA/Tae2 family protein
MQSVDFTTLTAACAELQKDWIPARIEQVYQCDRHTIAIALRTLPQRGWLTICWHPQAARICMGDAPSRVPDKFTFSDQLRHQLNGYILTALVAIAPWERVIDLQVAQRPGDPPIWNLYVEIMGKYSNVILTDAHRQIVTVAHQVTAAQSSVRTLQTGKPYELPPPLTGTTPNLQESQQRWQARVSLIPGSLKGQLLKSYRGLSPIVANSLIQSAQLDPEQLTDSLQESDWVCLFQQWQTWLQALETKTFNPGWTADGYTVLGGNMTQPTPSVQTLLNCYYRDRLNQQVFQQLRHQLCQKVSSLLAKLHVKADSFRQRLQQSAHSDEYRQQADLLMAHLSRWESGMKSITLPDFDTDRPIAIRLNPEKNGVQNAQALYKQHQKLKRARIAIEPLLQTVELEIDYLEQVEASLSQIESFNNSEDLQTLEEIREELIQQHYLDPQAQRSRNVPTHSHPYRYPTPSGFEVWIGRNNRQNDQLTFRIANDYDLWFHNQESGGSHVLLRLEPGTIPDELDLQVAANWAAYYSQARQSEQVPVVYTKPKHVYKPKGAKPGMVIYKQEQVLWGYPQQAKSYLKIQEEN